MELKRLIAQIISKDHLHAKWLNTISFLEHIGSRKIMKSQNSNFLNIEILQHLAEETKHAYFFKKLCHRNFGDCCPTYEKQYLLGKDAPEVYFQSLDAIVDKVFELNKSRATLSYLYVTWLVEERALEVYEVYAELLKSKGSPIRLTPVLVEEKDHLSETLNAMKKWDREFEVHSEELKITEQSLFNNLIQTLSESVTESINLEVQAYAAN